MRFSLFTYCLLFFGLFACTEKKAGNLTKEALTGNWLIVYPEHILKTDAEREVYGRHQNSLINQYGLKLISFENDRVFRQWDTSWKKEGEWLLAADSSLHVKGAKGGFQSFKGDCRRLANNELQLVQWLPLEGENIKVIWHLKKVEKNDPAASLFTPERNAWRQKPAASESAAAMKQRLAAMLTYWGDYFGLVGREAIYFLPTRSPLPFHYYQHAMAVANEYRPDFSALFYDAGDANRAYDLLEGAVALRRADYPSDKSFTLEYGRFMKELANALSK